MQIILYQPQIPQNCGNIVRTCSVTGTSLVLVPPFGFSINSRWLKRAGLDYWEGVDVIIQEDLDSYLSSLQTPFYFFSSHAKTLYTEVQYTADDHLIFGSETSGLPERFRTAYPDRFIKIPMLPDKRCLNLATSVGIGLYEAVRQTLILN